VGPGVIAPFSENLMLAGAEDAADAPEGDRCAKECRTQRHAAGVVVLRGRGAAGIEVDRFDWAVSVGQREPGTENLVHDDGAVGLLEPLYEQVELVAVMEIATHVDFVLEDISQRPDKLVAGGWRKNAGAAFVDRVVEIRGDYAANGERIDQFLVRGFDDERREDEICRLQTRSGDDDGLHRKDLLLFQAGCKPNGDRCQGRHDYITNRPNSVLHQSICLR